MKKLIRFIALAFVLVFAIGAVASSAAAYTTYTYSYGGQPLSSPDAYSPYKQIDSAYMGLPKTLNSPSDLYIDEETGDIYIVDPEAGTTDQPGAIYVLDSNYKYQYKIDEFVNSRGNNDRLKGASGVAVANGLLYIADTNNSRIVVLDRETLECVAIHDTPDADVVEEGDIYKPIALAVDNAGRMYVVSSTTIDGIISLNKDGSFASFIGAQKVTYNAFELFWRRFQSADERAQSEKNVSVTYDNICIDKDGFIYVTTSHIDEASQQSAISGKSKSGDYAPVKKLNAKGNEIMRRNGFWPPSGEVAVRNEYQVNKDKDIYGASTIVDVAIGPEETWSIIDQKRSRVFTYDKNGNLLHAFGDKGTQLGNLQQAGAIVYQGKNMLILDKMEKAFTVYNITEYGEVLLKALELTNNRQFTEAVEYWETILQSNNNYDAAYVGIGDAYYRSGDYEKAMDNYRVASDVNSYSEAFKRWRKDAVNDYLFIIVAVVVVFIIGLGKYLGFAGKVNKRVATQGGKRKFYEEFLYAHHVMFHPFDGFWDLKHEKRGSVRAATAWLVIAVVAFCYNAVGQSYMFSGGKPGSLIATALSVLVPLFLWVLANWCLTTLFEGEGSFKDIYVATCYALAPMPFLVICSTALTHVVSLSESGFVTLTMGLAWVWFFLLLFFGTMVTHDFQMGKNIITMIATVVGMALIMFVAVLFSGLLIKMATFVSNIITELTFS